MDDSRRNYLRKYRANYKTQVKRVNLTLSKKEFSQIEKVAKAEKKKISPFVKELALVGLNNQTRIPSSIQKELQTLRFAILNIANNVNQIAHHSNTIQCMTQAEENNLLQHLKQLDEVVRTYTTGQILSKHKDHDH